MSVYETWFNKFNFCGCYSPLEVLIDIKDYLNIVADKENKTPQYKRREERFKGTYEAFIAYFCDSHDLTGHGGSINTAWLTDSGKELLEELNKYENDKIKECLSDEK